MTPKPLRPEDVFSDQTSPKGTYVHRSLSAGSTVETELSEIIRHKGKLVFLTGPTKIGKSWMAKKVLTQAGKLRVAAVCTNAYSLGTIWTNLLAELKVEQIEQTVHRVENASPKSTVRLTGEIGGDLAGGKAGFEYTRERQAKATSTLEEVRRRAQREAGPALVAEAIAKIPEAILVLENFHTLAPAVRSAFCQAWQVFHEQGVTALLTSWNRAGGVDAGDLVELGMRSSAQEVPLWSIDELVQIPTQGFKLLGMEIEGRDFDLFQYFASESCGSPVVMQMACLLLANNWRGVKQKVAPEIATDILRSVWSTHCKHPYPALEDSLLEDARLAALEKSARSILTRLPIAIENGVLRETVLLDSLRAAGEEAIIASGDYEKVKSLLLKPRSYGEPCLVYDGGGGQLRPADASFLFYLRWKTKRPVRGTLLDAMLQKGSRRGGPGAPEQ